MNYSYLPLVKDKMDYDNIYITSIVMEEKDYTYQGLSTHISANFWHLLKITEWLLFLLLMMQ